MPFITCKVNRPISREQELALKARMGRTIELVPIYDQLAGEYGDQIAFRWVMGLLVKDVSDFICSALTTAAPRLRWRGIWP